MTLVGRPMPRVMHEHVMSNEYVQSDRSCDSVYNRGRGESGKVNNT